MAVLHHHLSEWAREHHGVFTRAQATDLGCSPSQPSNEPSLVASSSRSIVRCTGSPARPSPGSSPCSDSRRHHLGASAFERDRARQNQLELRGWIVLRFTWQTYVNRPHQIVGEIADALRDDVHTRSGVVL